jgi:hypothetical protein
MIDVWKSIPGYEGLYEAHPSGLVRSLDRVDRIGRLRRGRLLKAPLNSHGYPNLSLYKDGERHGFELHRVIALTFLKPADGRHEVNHKNGVKADCCVTNLEWCTSKENQHHSRRVLGNECAGPKRPLIAFNGPIEIRFESWMAAKRSGFNVGCIHAALHGKHQRKTHGGYQWRYA